MAGRKKTKEKEQAARTEVQQKAKMTREELGGQLLKGVRAEQLDTTTDDALYAKNRISRLSSLGATKALEAGFIKESNVKCMLPPRWQRLMSAEFTVDEWKGLGFEVKDLIGTSQLPPSSLCLANEPKLMSLFWKKVYEDEETMKLIKEAYKLGASDAYSQVEGGSESCLEKLKGLVEVHRKFIEFLITDNEEKVNPILTLTPRELVDRVTMYFIECDLVKRFYTLPGLAFHIGFSSREEFVAYLTNEENKDSIHVYILKRALTYIESERVVDMLYGGGLMAGHKLDLATNFNYNDAGKKNESAQPAQTNITVNNNTLSMQSAPPKPESLEEWNSWYRAEQEARKKADLDAAEAAKVIDVTP